MEFPNIGQHCSELTCNLLDFLPMKCDACEKIYCKDHFTYLGHHCPASYKKNVQVPLCPLCNSPIPVNRNELPDIKVGEHIDRDCKSNAQAKKIFVNRCSATGCKQKEMMPLKCETCKRNYCLKHRHPQDHDCQHSSRSNSSNDAMSQAGAAAMSRLISNQSKSKTKLTNKNVAIPKRTSVEPTMSEDEALARALQMSLLDNNSSLPEESEDSLLAKAIAASEAEYHKQQHRNNSSCIIT